MKEAASSGKLSSAVQGQVQFCSASDPQDEQASERRRKASAQSGLRYQECERFSYLNAAAGQFRGLSILSVVADAVHVGSEDWLNVVAYAPEKRLGAVLPQQARSGGQ